MVGDQLPHLRPGATKFQSTTNDYVWLDEEPEDFAIYSESLMRIIAKKGLIWMTHAAVRRVAGDPSLHGRRRGHLVQDGDVGRRAAP